MASPQFVTASIKVPGPSVSLPVIDISGLRSAFIVERAKVSEEIGEACRDRGFFYIVGHHVPSFLQQRVLEQAGMLFDLPAKEKRKMDQRCSIAYRGYESLRTQVLEAGAFSDVREGFFIGQEKPFDHPDVVAGKFNQGPNIWPSSLPEFRATMVEYQGELESLAQLLMRGIALSLGLAEEHFSTFCEDAMSTLCLLHYPPQSHSVLPGEIEYDACTDWGGLTLLLQGSYSGLQVWDRQSEGWVWATPVPGAYVVNLGNLVARWTNDFYRSTLYRVASLPGNERYLVRYVYSGNVDHRISCIRECLAPGEHSKYPELTIQEHYRNMFREADAR
ncbi:isopenicillin N synthase family dioxygenase [Klebsiella pneumoniae]|nr:hypothetical protein [Klebsiella pneumoniae]